MQPSDRANPRVLAACSWVRFLFLFFPPNESPPQSSSSRDPSWSSLQRPKVLPAGRGQRGRSPQCCFSRRKPGPTPQGRRAGSGTRTRFLHFGENNSGEKKRCRPGPLGPQRSGCPQTQHKERAATVSQQKTETSLRNAHVEPGCTRAHSLLTHTAISLRAHAPLRSTHRWVFTKTEGRERALRTVEGL